MGVNSNDKVQLKREELVGNDVVLEDINPKSNTNSIIDDDTGLSLEDTINRMWNAINNKLARIVNSVNGRTGVVVLNASDVGLGNVDNVSYADIQDWVINRIELEFKNKTIHLFDYLDEAEAIVTRQDLAYKWTPFYAKRGLSVTGDLLSYIGFFAWNPVQERLYYEVKAINVIGWADNSIIYNENIGDKHYAGGRLGVHIWQYEDALEIYNAAGGAKNNSGLRIKKDKVSNAVIFFNGCYGINGDITSPEATAFFDISLDQSNPDVSVIIDGGTPITAKLNNASDYKKNDVIICNFDDENYRTYNSTSGINEPKTGIVTAFIDTQPKIGLVTSAPTLDNPSVGYEITFHTIKPLTNFGLGYYTAGSVLGVKPVVGKINSDESSNDNLSGVNVIGDIKQNRDETVKKDFNTVTPLGPTKATYLNDDVNETVDGVSDGVAIIPDMSLNVIPKSKFGSGGTYLPNWPLKTAGDVDDKTGLVVDEKKITFLGVNLDKLIPLTEITYSGDQVSNVVYGYYDALHYEFYTDPGFTTILSVDPTDTVVDIPTGDLYHIENNMYESGSYGDLYHNISDLVNTSANTVNLSGLKITKNTDILPGMDSTPAHSHTGGLSVNTGKFLEIGNIDETPEDYYDSGKLNVRVDTSQGLHEVPSNSNALGVALTRDGGLVFDINGAIEVSLGMGMRTSQYDQTGEVGASHRRQYITPSINDTDIREPTYDTHVTTADERYFGGMRYIHSYNNDGLGPSYSAIGVRINDWHDTYNEPIRHGTEGLRITDSNVLGVQTRQSENDINPITIKGLRDFVEEYRGWCTVLPLSTMIFKYTEPTTPGMTIDPREAIVATYSRFGDTIMVPERCYMVKCANDVEVYTRRYVYVGDTVSQPTVNDYKPQFEFYSSIDEFNSTYTERYVLLTQEPSDWSNNCVRYYELSGDTYVHVTAGTTFIADTYYQLRRLDINNQEPNRDKVYVIGRYDNIELMTWGPRRTIYQPSVTRSPFDVTTNTGAAVDVISADDASMTLRAYSIVSGLKPLSVIFNEEQAFRANFYSLDQRISADDASYILNYYTYLSGLISIQTYDLLDPLPTETLWTTWHGEDDDPATAEFPPSVMDYPSCGFVEIKNPGHTSIPVYYVKQGNRYVPLKEAFPAMYTGKQVPSYGTIKASADYDGNIYQYVVPDDTVSTKTIMSRLRTWIASRDSSIHDPAMVDELVSMDAVNTIAHNSFNKTAKINHFEAGVDLNVGETRGLTVVQPSSTKNVSNSYGLSVKIHDFSSEVINSENQLNEFSAGGMRFGPGGAVAVRINENKAYNANTGTGDDDITNGSAGLRINPTTNVLGVKILPNSLGGLTLDTDGNVVMSGFIGLNTQPANWATNYADYFMLPDNIDTAYHTADELEYRKYHRKYSDFVNVVGVGNPVHAPTFAAGKYYIRLAAIG